MYRNRDISPDSTMLDALKRMDELDKKLLIVIQEDKFVGLLSAGDVQRAIIANKELDTTVDSILRKDIKLGKETDSIEAIKTTMIQFRMEFYPIIDENNQIIEIHFWEDLFSNEKASKGQFKAPVVIMAGGYGTRLKPLTNVIPKAMVPIGDKTMLEEIFDRFEANGCDTFFLSVNYKAELIEYYLKNQQLPYQIDYFKEVKPLGTAGSLTMLKGKINETFFVNNCDIIINEDYSEILNYHKKMKNKITIVAALKTYNIPYGTVESGEDGILQEIKEKPELNFMINSGMYILEPELLDRIPENTFYHITDLINELKDNGEQIGVFPVREKAWIDMGDWAEYMDAIKS